jgi:3-dehydroquinate synthase
MPRTAGFDLGMPGELQRQHIRSSLGRSYDVILMRGLFDPERPVAALPQGLKPRTALLVTTPTVMGLYGDRVVSALRNAGFALEILVLRCRERTKTLAQVTRVCRAALDHGLDRDAALIALGGGVCLDIVTVAASWIRRGIACIRIPTTLIGQIDAGLGAKGAVNFRGRKSYLGCFNPPEFTILDPAALRTLPRRHVRAGMAEMIKIALVRDAALFGVVESHATTLIASRFHAPSHEGVDAVWRAAAGMLAELEPNLYENVTSKRFVDMGHTFSPAIESASGFRISHGEAVAIDLALSAVLSFRLGWLDERECLRIVRAIVACGLPITAPVLTERLALHALEDAASHRRHPVIPAAIGAPAFVDDDGRCLRPLLAVAMEWLAERAAGMASTAVMDGHALTSTKDA